VDLDAAGCGPAAARGGRGFAGWARETSRRARDGTIRGARRLGGAARGDLGRSAARRSPRSRAAGRPTGFAAVGFRRPTTQLVVVPARASAHANLPSPARLAPAPMWHEVHALVEMATARAGASWERVRRDIRSPTRRLDIVWAGPDLQLARRCASRVRLRSAPRGTPLRAAARRLGTTVSFAIIDERAARHPREHRLRGESRGRPARDPRSRATTSASSRHERQANVPARSANRQGPRARHAAARRRLHAPRVSAAAVRARRARARRHRARVAARVTRLDIRRSCRLSAMRRSGPATILARDSRAAASDGCRAPRHSYVTRPSNPWSYVSRVRGSAVIVEVLPAFVSRRRARRTRTSRGLSSCW